MSYFINNQATYFNIPGLRNSNTDHWQSIWESIFPDNFKRIHQSNWETPDMIKWTDQLEVILHNPSIRLNDVILVGHSIGCATIAHWATRFKHKVRGALLVAPSDPEQKNYPEYITGFSPIPKNTLSFPSIVVASSNDHVVGTERAQFFAKCWGSQYHEIAEAGHFEPKSGIGEFSIGLRLLQSL